MNPFKSARWRVPRSPASSSRRYVKTALSVLILLAGMAFAAPARQSASGAQAVPAEQASEELWKESWAAAEKADGQGQYQEAERYLRAALAQAERFGPQDPRLARTLSRLADHLFTQQRFAEAIELLKRALAATGQTTPAEKSSRVNTLNSLAMMFEANNQDAEAETCYKQALATVQASDPPDPLGLKLILNNLGSFYQERNRYMEAEEMFRQLLEVARNDPRANHPRSADAAYKLANVYEAQGKYSEAERTLLDEIDAEEQQGEANVQLARALLGLADHLKGEKEEKAYEEAALNYQRALQVFEKLPKGSGRLPTATCVHGLADLYDQWGMPDKAESLYLRELDIEMEYLGKRYTLFPSGLIGLANLYRKQGRLEEILPRGRQALTRLEQDLGPDHPSVADSLIIFAQYTEELGNHTEAEALLRRASSIQEKALGPDHPQVADTLQQLVGVLRASGQEAEAGRIIDRIQKTREGHKPQAPNP
jgi:tetratricopeptide (TPR) repeat protein